MTRQLPLESGSPTVRGCSQFGNGLGAFGLALDLWRVGLHVEAQKLLLIAVVALRSSMVAGNLPFPTGFAAQRVALIGLRGVGLTRGIWTMAPHIIGP